MERQSRPERTVRKEITKKHCTARSYGVKLGNGEICMASTNTVPCVSGSIKHEESLSDCEWEIGNIRSAGVLLAKVQGVHQNSDKLLLKQASHIHITHVRVAKALVHLVWRASINFCFICSGCHGYGYVCWSELWYNPSLPADLQLPRDLLADWQAGVSGRWAVGNGQQATS